MSKFNRTKNEYLDWNVQDYMTEPGIEAFSPETLAYIEREARKSRLLAALRGAAVKGGTAVASLPGDLMTPRKLLLTAATLGSFPIAYGALKTYKGALGGALEYATSRQNYRQLYDYIKQLEEEESKDDDTMSKQAAKIDYGGMLARRMAQEGKHSSGYTVRVIPTVIDDPYTKGTFTGKLRDDDIKAQLYKKILEKMEEQNPEELKDVVVHLGGTRSLSDAVRTISNKNLGVVSKALNALYLPNRMLTSTFNNALRSDHYDPASNAVTLYDDNPAVLTHELGHAIDYNRYKGWDRFKKNWKYRMNQLSDEAEANSASEQAIINAFKDNPKVLSVLQTLRLRTLPRGYYTYNTKFDWKDGLKNEYNDKQLKELLDSGKIGHKYIMDEHINLPTKDLIEILQNELLTKELKI